MLNLKDRYWSPYWAGIIIGLLQIPAFLLIDTAIGTSSSYVTITANVASLFDPGIGAMEYATKHLDGAKNLWQVFMVFGVALGAYLSSRLSGMRRQGISPIWAQTILPHSKEGRFVTAFIAGFIILLGARLADGCTSGHGISGMAQLAVSSYITIAAMFGAGIATAFLIKKK